MTYCTRVCSAYGARSRRPVSRRRSMRRVQDVGQRWPDVGTNVGHLRRQRTSSVGSKVRCRVQPELSPDKGGG